MTKIPLYVLISHVFIFVNINFNAFLHLISINPIIAASITPIMYITIRYDHGKENPNHKN